MWKLRTAKVNQGFYFLPSVYYFWHRNILNGQYSSKHIVFSFLRWQIFLVRYYYY